MTLERRLFRRLRGFMFEEDEAEVKAIIKREVRRAAPGRGAEVTETWVDEAMHFKPGAFMQVTAEEMSALRAGASIGQIVSARTPETTGVAVPADERRPPRALGEWADVWNHGDGKP